MRVGLRWLLGPLALSAMLAGGSVGVRASDPIAGSQGVDTALPPTPSAVTISGRGPWSGLTISVNQTKELLNQAVSITWTGMAPTDAAPARFSGNYMQIFQCWGDSDGTNPTNPGPPPEQCQQGAANGVYGGFPNSIIPDNRVASRVISQAGWSNFDATKGFVETATGFLWKPFRAVDGTVVNVQSDSRFIPGLRGTTYWLNPYFNSITTNEVYGGNTRADGTGGELFEVQTGLQASGLGCGQKVQAVGDGTKKVPKCWIVIVPRGTAVQENVGTPFEGATNVGVQTSPLTGSSWANRIAIPIEFRPVDASCALSDVERRISGSELAVPAVSSWQPVLCEGGSRPPFSYAPISDEASRSQIASSVPGGPGMALISKPLSTNQVTPSSPVVYAPMTLSGLVIGFNIERAPLGEAPPEAQQLAGSRIAQINLTPRLVAKLLTQSYSAQINIYANGLAPYTWDDQNPSTLAGDPDFIRFNPEFAQLLATNERTMSGLQLPTGTSDAAQQLWNWVLADPEARTWLEGQPDQWGMKVNPVYAITAAANTTGSPFIPGNTFPKAEPYCYKAPPLPTNTSVVPPPLCGTDWLPYNRGYADGARITRVAFDGARIVYNPVAENSSQVWRRDQPQLVGSRGIITLTDTVSAIQYGLQVARLSRAGDNGATRTFIEPNQAGLLSGLSAMKAADDPAFLVPDPTAAVANAYPLTTITYAVAKPLALSAAERDDFAAFIEYATGAGQTPGFERGKLPPGYAPLSPSLVTQAKEAVNSIRTMTVPTPTTTTTTPSASTAPPSPTTTVRTNVTVRPTTARPVQTVAPGTTLPAEETTTVPSETTTTTTEPTETTAAPSTTVVESAGPVPSTTIAVTAGTEVPAGRFLVGGLGVAALGSALGALEISKRARRATASPQGVAAP